MPPPADLARRIADAAPACGSTTVVAIDGRSGAGKTALARRLASELGAELLHLDDVYRGWHGLADAPATVAHDVLEPISRGEAGRTPRWEWGSDRPGADLVIAPADVLVLDGCGSGSRILRPRLSFLIWMDGDPAIRRARVEARDGQTVAQWWDDWAAQEDDLFAAEQTRSAADVVLQ